MSWRTVIFMTRPTHYTIHRPNQCLIELNWNDSNDYIRRDWITKMKPLIIYKISFEFAYIIILVEYQIARGASANFHVQAAGTKQVHLSNNNNNNKKKLIWPGRTYSSDSLCFLLPSTQRRLGVYCLLAVCVLLSVKHYSRPCCV